MKDSRWQAEAAIISAMMNDEVGLLYAMENIKPEEITFQFFRVIFDIMIDLFNNSKKIDLVTIMQKLEIEMPGFDITLLNEIDDMVLSAGNIEAHHAVIKEWALIQQTKNIAQNTIKMIANKEPILNIIEATRNNIINLEDETVRKEKSFNEIAFANMKVTEDILSGEVKPGLHTNITDLDKHVIMNPGDLIIIAAKRGVGKTALANQIAFSAAANNKKTILFNTEMTQRDIMCREISRLSARSSSPIAYKDINFGRFDINSYQYYSDVFANMQGTIDDSGYQTMATIRSKMTRARTKMNGLDLVVIDYVQLIRGGNGNNRQQQLADISRESKLLARDFEVPIIMLSQLNHDFVTREAEDLENDADIVLKLFRPFIDGYMTQVKDGKNKILRDNEWVEPEPEFSILKIDKNRKGELDKIRLYFDGRYQAFYGWGRNYV